MTWSIVVLSSKLPQLELVVTYRVRSAIQDDVMNILMAMKTIDKTKRPAYEGPVISTLFHAIPSGWGKLTDSIKILSFLLNLSLSGSPGIQQNHLLNLKPAELNKEYFRQTLMKAYLDFKFRKWMIA